MFFVIGSGQNTPSACGGDEWSRSNLGERSSLLSNKVSPIPSTNTPRQAAGYSWTANFYIEVYIEVEPR